MRRRVLAAAAAATVLIGADASAQTSPPAWRPWRPLIAVGVGWIATDTLGSVTAATRTAAVGTSTPAPFTLFRTDSTLGGAARAELGLGLALTQSLAVEVVGTAARPTLETRISGDAEGAVAVTASERVDEYTVGARASYEWRRWSWWGRARPFVAAGGAYLRQLHQDQALVETGQMWTASGGVRWFLRGGGPRHTRPLGLAGEFGWAWRTGGIAFVDGARSMPTAQLRLFAAF